MSREPASESNGFCPPEEQRGTFCHPLAEVESRSIGAGTRIWAFAHVLPGARIGRDCNICDHTFIENDVVLGDRVTVKCGVQLWDGIELEDDVFVGPNATFTNDPFPRSRQHLQSFARTVVKQGASIGANATVLPGLIIGQRAMVGAGAVVTRNVPPDTIVAGNPARIMGYVGAESSRATDGLGLPSVQPARSSTRVNGVTLHRLPFVEDLRGSLSYGEAWTHLPFELKRYFLVFNVSSHEIRGEHAHRRVHQFLIAVHGSCHCVADDGVNREEFILDHPTLGLHLPPMTWSVQYKYSSDAVLLVFASESYDASEYIRDRAEFLELLRR